MADTRDVRAERRAARVTQAALVGCEDRCHH